MPLLGPLRGSPASPKLLITSLEDGRARAISGDFTGLSPMQWSADGAAIYLRIEGLPGRIDRLDLSSGRVEPWRQIKPREAVGAMGVVGVAMTSDGSAYAYSYGQALSRLYLMDGAK
jgi:eukaryotic-like serine/threonine-protein kinase